MIHGTVRQAGREWTVEHRYSVFAEPQWNTVAWKVTGARRTGPFAPDLADGLAVDHCGMGSDRFQAYAQGDYLILETEHEGTVTLSDYPCPKVRGGIATRYRNGRWEKCLRAGWVPA